MTPIMEMIARQCSGLQSALVQLDLQQFLTDESAQDLVEYALLAALIGLATVSAMKGLSNKISSSYNNIASTVNANN